MTDSLVRYTISKPAAADLSSQQYHAVVLNSSGKVELHNGATDVPYGILQNEPVTDEAASVCPIGGGGSSKIILGQVMAIGELVSFDASGEAVDAASSSYTAGILETGGNTGDIGRILLNNLIVKA